MGVSRVIGRHSRRSVLGCHPRHNPIVCAFSDTRKEEAPASTAASDISTYMNIYFELSKFRLSAVVVSTAVAGYGAGAIEVGAFDPLLCTTVTVGTFMAATSANTFNQVIETDLDRKMARTRLRPLPSGRISKTHANLFGLGIGAASALALGVGANPLTAALGVLNIGLYAGPYTLSKPKTEWNTWIGAVVGAVPPLMGWAASGATLAAPEPWIYATTLFLWQFPHFFLVAWKYRRDYTMGGYQMVAVNDSAEGTRTANQILVSSTALSLTPIAAAALGAANFDFETIATTTFLLGGNAFANYKFRQDKKTSKAQFAWSHLSLPFLLIVLLYEQAKVKREKRQKAQKAEQQLQQLQTAPN